MFYVYLAQRAPLLAALDYADINVGHSYLASKDGASKRPPYSRLAYKPSALGTLLTDMPKDGQVLPYTLVGENSH